MSCIFETDLFKKGKNLLNKNEPKTVEELKKLPEKELEKILQTCEKKYSIETKLNHPENMDEQCQNLLKLMLGGGK